MKFLILFALVAGALASDKYCPPNFHYEECGTACPITCDNHENPPKMCVQMCVPGCFCDKGYVQTEDGKCVKPETCAEEAKKCKVWKDPGACRGFFPSWFFDDDKYKCKQFIYGGCGGNGNRFATEAQCMNKCYKGPDCESKPDPGLCNGSFPMWYHDTKIRNCKEFTYGGCLGNKNRYATQMECLETCVGIYDSDSDRCSQPAETGMCRGYFPRYHFDKASGQCKQFVYGGCGGNENNFRTEEECQSACGSQAS